MAGRVDDVDLDAVIANRRVLGEDGDALLSLEHVRIHDQLTDLLMRGEDVRLLQQGVDERGLAMVNVRDDGHVAQIGTAPRFQLGYRHGRTILSDSLAGLARRLGKEVEYQPVEALPRLPLWRVSPVLGSKDPPAGERFPRPFCVARGE